jgi:hypothetical protein
MAVSEPRILTQRVEVGRKDREARSWGNARGFGVEGQDPLYIATNQQLPLLASRPVTKTTDLEPENQTAKEMGSDCIQEKNVNRICRHRGGVGYCNLGVICRIP